jgi:hypothetical protein
MCAVYGEDSIAERTTQKWFAHLMQGNFDMSDSPSSGRHLVGYGWIIHCELLERNLTVTAERYCQQLRHLEEAIQHDNARRHTANMTKAVIQELDWEILPHPPYSPNLAPSDHHLFRSLS